MAADSELTPVTRRLCRLRGISTLTGFALAVEIGDWHRRSGASIGSYLEAAWHHKPAYRRGVSILNRWAATPAPVVARADAGNRRLHARCLTLDARKNKHTVACTAIARELAGWCWSLAVIDD